MPLTQIIVAMRYRGGSIAVMQVWLQNKCNASIFMQGKATGKHSSSLTGPLLTIP
jgi:hypothetical protein